MTLQAIAAEAGATNGSIYHRFASVDELIARLWLATRAQAAALDASGDERGPGTVVQVALAIYDFCLAHRDDAVLLAAFRPRELSRLAVGPATCAAIEGANEPVEDLIPGVARARLGHAPRADRELLHVRRRLAAAVEAALAER